MTIAFDASSIVTQGSGQLNWTHTPVGVPKGILVMIVEYVSGADGVTTVTYGGVSCTEITNSPAIANFGEQSTVHCFFLGSGIPTGAQTVTVNISGAVTRRAVAVSYTADTAKTRIVDSEIFQSVGFENPSVTLSHAGQFCCDIVFGISGVDTVGEIAPLSGWNTISETDFGTEVGVWYPVVAGGTADVTAGWTALSEDVNFLAVAIGEVFTGGGSGGGKPPSGGSGGKPPSGGGGGSGGNLPGGGVNKKVGRAIAGQRRVRRGGLVAF